MPSPHETKPVRRSGSNRRQKTAQAAVRFTPQEMDHVRREATRAGKSVADYIRGLVLTEVA